MGWCRLHEGLPTGLVKRPCKCPLGLRLGKLFSEGSLSCRPQLNVRGAGTLRVGLRFSGIGVAPTAAIVASTKQALPKGTRSMLCCFRAAAVMSNISMHNCSPKKTQLQPHAQSLFPELHQLSACSGRP